MDQHNEMAKPLPTILDQKTEHPGEQIDHRFHDQVEASNNQADESNHTRKIRQASNK
jgi:hypothetical protein